MKNKILIILLTLFCSFSIFATDYSFVENPTSLPDKVYTDIALNYNPNSIGTSLFVGFNPFAIGFEGKVNSKKESDNTYTVLPSLTLSFVYEYDYEINKDFDLSLGISSAYTQNYIKRGLTESQVSNKKNAGLKFFKTHFMENGNYLNINSAASIIYKDSLALTLILNDFNKLTPMLSYTLDSSYINLLARLSFDNLKSFGCGAEITLFDTLSLFVDYSNVSLTYGAELYYLFMRLKSTINNENNYLVQVAFTYR